MDLLCEWREWNADSIEEFVGLLKCAGFFFLLIPFRRSISVAEIKTIAHVFSVYFIFWFGIMQNLLGRFSDFLLLRV